MKQFIKLVFTLAIVCVLLTSGCISNDLNEQEKTNEIIQNKAINIYNSEMEIVDMFYEFDVLINTKKYSDAIILCERIEYKTNEFEEEINDMKSFTDEQYLEGNIDKDTYLYFTELMSNAKRGVSLQRQSAIYLQKYAESLEKGDFSEAERYYNLVEATITDMNELTLEIEKLNSERHG